MEPKELIQARIDELNQEMQNLLQELREKKEKFADPAFPTSQAEITQFLQHKTVQVLGLRSAIAELTNIKGML